MNFLSHKLKYILKSSLDVNEYMIIFGLFQIVFVIGHLLKDILSRFQALLGYF